MFGSLSTFDPFVTLRQLEREIDQAFGRWTPAMGIRYSERTFPPINVGATDEGVEVYLFAPGLDPATLELSIQQNLLTIGGERKLPVDANATYYRQERFGGQFKRVVTLPDDVDPDRVDAKYRDGVLQVSIARQATARPRQIQVQ